MNEDLRDAVNDAIAWHVGDVRATIGTLLADCAHLCEQLDASRAMGHGFTCGWRPASERE